MILAIFLSVVALLVVIVPIIIFMCTEADTPPPSVDIQYEKEKKKKLNLPKPSENIENFSDNADEISVNADYHVLKSNAKKPSELLESPDNIDEVGFRINRNNQKQVESSGSDGSN